MVYLLRHERVDMASLETLDGGGAMRSVRRM
jgi:hypothetical protein